MVPWVPRRCWFRASWEGRGAISDVVAPRTGSTTPVPPPAPSPPPICSRGGGFDADGPATSGAFFFGGMSVKAMEIYLARTPDQVHTTSTPPTWRAKDVGGNRPPRTPMGTEPLLGSVGGGGCAKSGSRRHTHKRFLPSFGPHGCVKPYCCLSNCIEFLLGSARCYSKLEVGRGWMTIGFLPSTRAWASFYSTRGYPQVAAQM